MTKRNPRGKTGRIRHLPHRLRHPLVPHPLQLLHPLPRPAPRLGRLHAPRRPGPGPGPTTFLSPLPLPTTIIIIIVILPRRPRRPARRLGRLDRRHARDPPRFGFRERDEGAHELDPGQGRGDDDAGREGGVEDEEAEEEEAVIGDD